MRHLHHIKPLGHGGFGNVDEVKDNAGAVFARKTFSANQPLPVELLVNVRKRFSKEVRIQGGISHPNIVPIIESDLDADPPSYLMPLAQCTLADDLDADRTLGGHFISAISDIVSGLEELHSMEIFHRDLKPRNVLKFLKDGDGESSFYAVSDFGLISLRESRLSVLTRTGMRKSSDFYTAPEITRELKAASIQSDIYSLGCIFHDMVGTEERVPCSEIREDNEFSAIFLGCTHRDPARRFKSARAVLDSILSIDFTSSVPRSAESINFTRCLDGDDVTPDGFWPRLADFLEHEATDNDRSAIFGKLNLEKIAEAFEADPASANSIGIVFSRWVASSSFRFEYCDALADRLQAFFARTNLEAKVECMIALLEMGTSHNRWYVERKFANLAGPTMEPALAKRFAVQLRIIGEEVCRSFDHLEFSISFERTDLHPIVRDAVEAICK